MGADPVGRVTDEAPIEGLADRVARMDDLDDEHAARSLEPDLRSDGVPVGSERSLGDTLERTVAWLRRSQVIEDLGEMASSVEILGLHVPPGGRAALDVRTSAVADRQVSLRVFGFGFGSGRTLSVELAEGIAERGTCMRILQHVDVHVRRFQTKGDGAGTEALIRTDVVRCGARELIAWPTCPYCATDDEPDPFEYDLESDGADALDLRSFDADVTRERTVRLEGVRTAEIGLDVTLPNLGPASVGYHVEQRTSLSCTIRYTFPSGRRFMPFRRLGDTAALPYWRAW